MKESSSSHSLLRDIQILIHLIDGFEIEESNAPFPILKGELPDIHGVDARLETAPKRRLAGDGVDDPLFTAEMAGSALSTSDNNHHSNTAPPLTKIAKHSQNAAGESTTVSEVKLEAGKSPAKSDAARKPDERIDGKTRPSGSSEEEEEEEDSISIGSKELLSQEEMNVDYGSSPPSHSPVSFPLRDVSSTDSFPSSYHQLENVEELVDEKPAIFLCEPDVDKSIADWTEQDVYHFISGIEGCSQYAEEFISQEIDGQALLLLNEDHLMSNLNVKLGPALKILAKIQENNKK